MGLDVLSVRWKYPSRSVELTVEFKLGTVSLEVIVHVYVLVNKYY